MIDQEVLRDAQKTFEMEAKKVMGEHFSEVAFADEEPRIQKDDVAIDATLFVNSKEADLDAIYNKMAQVSKKILDRYKVDINFKAQFMN